jgi:hypothetical protein
MDEEQVAMETPAAEVAPAPARGTPAYNMAQLRIEKEEAQAQARKMAQELERLKAQRQSPVEEDYDSGRELLTKAEAEAAIQRGIDRRLQEESRRTLPQRMEARYKDFNEVVTIEALDALTKAEPELAAALDKIPDHDLQAVSVYKLLKSRSPAPAPTSVKTIEEKKFAENATKPRSINSVAAQSPIGNAHVFENGLTPELKASLYKEMQKARKR